MAECPILFSAPMIRAILAGTKTQTRRAIKPHPYVDEQGNACWNGFNYGQDAMGVPLFKTLVSPIPSSRTGRVLCPYGKPGDRLWVRETWMDLQGTGIEIVTGSRSRYAYGADSPPGSYSDKARKDYGLKWRPSIHMPRTASRITLEVTGVRVERLQAISDADAQAEGIVPTYGGWGLPGGEHYHCYDPRHSYLSLWESINGDGSVMANPWVWAVEFRALHNVRAERPQTAAPQPE